MIKKGRLPRSGRLAFLWFTVFLTLALLGPGSVLATSYTLSPAADALVADGSYADTNFGGQTWFFVSGYTPKGRPYLKFDLSGIPDGQIITQATLHLYQTSYMIGGADVVVDLHPVANDSWMESGITWNNRPDSGSYGAKLDTQTVAMTDPFGVWMSWNLLASPGAWNWSADLNDNAVSLLIKANDESLAAVAYFRSKEGSSGQPYLEITTEVVPAPCTLLLFASGLLGLSLAGARKTSV